MFTARYQSSWCENLIRSQTEASAIGSGRATPNFKTAISDWQGRLKTLFDDAKVSDGHAHRFRDTFGVELLLAGVPVERVSILVGHASIKITEKHYNPWIRERQEQAEVDVRRTWTKDSIVLLETKGTPEVRGTAEVVN
jgi:integrase